MHSLITALFLLIATPVFAGQDVTFMQNGAVVTSVKGNTSYQIIGHVPAKLTWVGLCVAIGSGYHCQQVLTDSGGDFIASSDIDYCKFEVASDFVTCDYSPRMIGFAVWKWGQGNRIMATGQLEVK